MNDVAPRRVTLVGIISLVAGVLANVLVVASRGGGLAGGGVAGYVSLYVFYGGVVLILVGAIAGLARRGWGVTLMLAVAMLQVGWLLGGQLSLRLLIAPGAL
jgi:hypothetical protein